MFGTDIEKLLGLSKGETKVLGVLQKHGAVPMADLVRLSSLPRMTAYGVVDSLVRRGLVATEKENKKKKYVLRSETVSAVKGVAKSSGPVVGKVGLYALWQELQKLPPHSRVQAIQPTASVKETLRKLDWKKEVEPLQRGIIDKPIIIEGLLPESYYPFLYNFYKTKDREFANKVIGSFSGRPTDMVFIPDELLDAKSELFILPHAAYIANWKNETMVEIKDKDMVDLLRKMFILARGYGKKVNQEEYLAGLLKYVNVEKGASKRVIS